MLFFPSFQTALLEAYSFSEMSTSDQISLDSEVNKISLDKELDLYLG